MPSAQCGERLGSVALRFRPRNWPYPAGGCDRQPVHCGSSPAGWHAHRRLHRRRRVGGGHCRRQDRPARRRQTRSGSPRPRRPVRDGPADGRDHPAGERCRRRRHAGVPPLSGSRHASAQRRRGRIQRPAGMLLLPADPGRAPSIRRSSASAAEVAIVADSRHPMRSVRPIPAFERACAPTLPSPCDPPDERLWDAALPPAPTHPHYRSGIERFLRQCEGAYLNIPERTRISNPCRRRGVHRLH